MLRIDMPIEKNPPIHFAIHYQFRKEFLKLVSNTVSTNNQGTFTFCSFSYSVPTLQTYFSKQFLGQKKLRYQLGGGGSRQKLRLITGMGGGQCK